MGKREDIQIPTNGCIFLRTKLCHPGNHQNDTKGAVDGGCGF